MDIEKAPTPAVEPFAKASQSPEQVPVTPKAAPPKKAGAKVPEGYKLVKISNPDGTYKIVLRPIKKAAVPVSPSTVPAKDATQPLKPVTGDSSALKTLTKDAEQVPKVTAEKPSITTPATATPKKTEASVEKKLAPPAHTSKLDAVSKSARIYRRFHRFHRHASRIAAAFDPDFGDYDDFEDGGADEDGDITVGEGSDDDSGSESDDSDREHDGQQTSQANSGNRTTGNGAQVLATNVARIPPRTTANPAPASKTPQVTVEEKRGSQSSNGFSKETSVQEKEIFPVKALLAEAAHIHGPRPLPKRYADVGRIVVWSLVILFPLAFIGLGIATAKLKGKPSSHLVDVDYSEDSDFLSEVYHPTKMGYAVTHATKAAITAWPIVFAAILAQTLKAIATYQVERGIRLRTLEQLISSHSVASALKQPFILRKMDWITFVLLALWALSPLGSQAMQYTTYTIKNNIPNNNTIYYLNTAQENPGLSNSFQAVNNYSDSMDVLYAAVFQQVSQYKPKASDPWGNPLVPVYETVQTPPPVDETTILTVDVPTQLYSSYYGIPLADVSEYDGGYGGVWNFSMNSSYLYLDCPALRFETWDDITDELADLDLDPRDFPSTTGESLWMNMTAPKSLSQPGNLTFISSCTGNRTEDGDPLGDPLWAFTICSLTQTFVLSNVSCQNTNCTVITVQKQPNHKPTEMQNFMDEFVKASDTGLSTYPYIGNTTYSITELYLRDKTNATTPGAGGYCDLRTVASYAPSVFTQDLAYLVNTYYSTGFTHDFTVGAINSTSEVPLLNVTSGKIQDYPLMASTLGLHDYQSPTYPTVYGINWRFLALYIACAAVLLLIGIIGVLFESWTIAPDILGFASSVARHSKYVKLPKVDGTMSGGERARIMGDSRVMMQDVRPDDPVGKIVLGSVTEGAHRLTRERSYK